MTGATTLCRDKQHRLCHAIVPGLRLCDCFCHTAIPAESWTAEERRLDDLIAATGIQSEAWQRRIMRHIITEGTHHP